VSELPASKENEAFEVAFLRYSDRIATVTPDGQVLTFGVLHGTVKAFAAKLRACGIGPGAVVAPVTENPAVFHALVLALLRVGATVASVSNPDIAVGRGLCIDFGITLPDLPALTVFNIHFGQSWFGFSGDDSIGPDGQLLLPSSGTTGEPKYYRAAQSIIRAWAEARCAGYDVRDADMLMTIPAHSTYGLSLMLQTTLFGGAVFWPRASADETLRTLRPQQPLDLVTTPAFLADFLKAAEKGASPPAKLRAVMLGGSPVSRQFAERAEAVLGLPVYNSYGSTETGGNAYCRPTRSIIGTGLVGKPVPPSEFRIEDESGEALPPGMDGIFAVRVPQAARVSEAMTGSFPYDGDGWFRSGDLGYTDVATGDFVLTSRVSDLINSSGSKAAPGKYEKMALTMTPADMAVAFGIPNALGTEDVGLAVVAPEAIDTVALERGLKDRVGDYLDFHVRQLDAIPLGATGKPDRAALRRMFAETA